MISCSPFLGIRQSPYTRPALHESLSGPNRFSRVHCLQLFMQTRFLAKDMNGHELEVGYQKRRNPTRRTGGSWPDRLGSLRGGCNSGAHGIEEPERVDDAGVWYQ